MASSVFSETLRSITTTKLGELSKKRSAYESQKSALLSRTSIEVDNLRRVKVLLDGVKKCFAVKTAPRKRGDRRGGPGQIIPGSAKDPQLEILLRSLESFLDQAHFDPSISTKQVLDWEQSLITKLDIRSRKYQYAELYGALVTEWLRADKEAALDSGSETSEGFEKISRVEKDESRANWEKTVFESHDTDSMAISEYLLALFGENAEDRQPFKGLQALWRAVKAFELSLSTPDQFNDHVLKWTINGLLASGLLSDEKRAVLKDFLASQMILTEIADVLNMRISDISTWSWEDEVPIEQRRHVTGAYHIYIDEELLQAIFLQYIGIKWSVFFKEAFINFTNYDGAWTSLRPRIPQDELQRREYFLGPQMKKGSLNSKRQAIYKSFFFMSQLPDSPYEESSMVDGEEEVQYDADRPAKRIKLDGQPLVAPQGRQMAVQMQVGVPLGAQNAPGPMGMQTAWQMTPQMRQQQTYAQQAFHASLPQNSPSAKPNYRSFLHPHNDEEYDLEPSYKKPKSSMETKQFLLHLLSTELLINTKLHGEFTCSRAELYSFFPTLPHSTIRSVLSFFCLSKKWQSFFQKYLSAPLKFADEPDAAPRLRKRGVPGAHALSSVCGEMILFCLDYAVNQATKGRAQLYRMHDDFWLWSHDQDVVVKSWEAVTSFVDIMGLSLNENKTGSVRILSSNLPQAGEQAPFQVLAGLHPSLPKGEIRWGFLLLDPLTGKFEIDQEIVDTHIASLSTQLKSKESSLFAWIQAWNTYASTFFSTNFGRPANIFGREHVDMLLSTMGRIQKSLFNPTSDSKTGNVISNLKAQISQRFGIKEDDIPDGFLYFPTHLGGLALNNPFIKLTQTRNKVFEQPSLVLDDFLDAEQEAYRKAKIAFESGKVKPKDTRPPRSKEFFSLEEFVKYREEFMGKYEGNLLSNYCDFLEQPSMDTGEVDVTGEEGPLGLKSLREAGLHEGYDRWVAGLYGKEVVEAFGGLQIVERGLLPMGMVSLFKSGKVKWQG